MFYSYSTPKGDIASATLIQTLPTGVENPVVNLMNSDNYNVSFTANGDNVVIEGNHTLLFNVTNSYGVSITKTLIYRVDQTAPTPTLNVVEPTTASSINGIVTVSFSGQDTGSNASGVYFMRLDWGNNITINATGLAQATMNYKLNGNYDIVLTVYDRAGNSALITQTVTIARSGNQQISNTSSTPLPLFPVFIALFGLGIMVRYRQKYST